MNTLVVDAYLDELLTDVSDAPVVADAGAAPRVAVVSPEALAPPAAGPVAIAAEPLLTPLPAPAAPEPQPVQTPQPFRAPNDTAGNDGDARPMPRPATTSRWLRLGIGRDHYAFELLRVQEVVRVAPTVAMRGAPPAVIGVMNLRGRIVPVFDLGRWLGGDAVLAGEQSRIVVVERDDELIGVLVTAVEDVATLAREHIEPPLVGSDAGAILGIARIGRSPTVLLDANALFA